MPTFRIFLRDHSDFFYFHLNMIHCKALSQHVASFFKFCKYYECINNGFSCLVWPSETFFWAVQRPFSIRKALESLLWGRKIPDDGATWEVSAPISCAGRDVIPPGPPEVCIYPLFTWWLMFGHNFRSSWNQIEPAALVDSVSFPPASSPSSPSRAEAQAVQRPAAPSNLPSRESRLGC